MEHRLRKAALGAAALLVLTAGAAPVEASPIVNVPITLGAGGSLTLGVDVNPNGVSLTGFDFGLSLPGDVAITGVSAGPLLPPGSMSLFFLLDSVPNIADILNGDDPSVISSPLDVFIVMASGSAVKTQGTLFSLMLKSLVGVNGSLTFGPSLLDPAAASLVGAACDADPASAECNIGFLASFNSNNQTIHVDVAPTAVPEPATIVLIGSGLVAAAWRRKRSTKVGQNSRQSFVVNSSLHKTKVF